MDGTSVGPHGHVAATGEKRSAAEELESAPAQQRMRMEELVSTFDLAELAPESRRSWEAFKKKSDSPQHALLGFGVTMRVGEDASMARQAIAEEQPYLVIGSPSGIRASSKENAEKKMGHLKEVSAMYAQQHRHGKLFVHTAEREATTWQAKCMRELLTLQDVEMVQRGDAAWLTNSRAIAQ